MAYWSKIAFFYYSGKEICGWIGNLFNLEYWLLFIINAWWCKEFKIVGPKNHTITAIFHVADVFFLLKKRMKSFRVVCHRITANNASANPIWESFISFLSFNLSSNRWGIILEMWNIQKIILVKTQLPTIIVVNSNLFSNREDTLIKPILFELKIFNTGFTIEICYLRIKNSYLKLLKTWEKHTSNQRNWTILIFLTVFTMNGANLFMVLPLLISFWFFVENLSRIPFSHAFYIYFRKCKRYSTC
jgi:hypothetical protein